MIARATLAPGGGDRPRRVVTAERIPAGHKVAVRPLAVGEAIQRYGQIIGFATQPIAPGQHVHVQNCGMGEFARDYAYSEAMRPTQMVNDPATFMGIRRPDGAGRHAQLYRHPDQRELFRPCRGRGRRCVPQKSVHRA